MMMFNKVLIAEDHQSVNVSLRQTLDGFGVGTISYAYYCDDAFTQLKKAVAEHSPFDLLVTDLSFFQEGNTQNLNDGKALISAARLVQPLLPVLVFSAERQPDIVNRLYHEFDINGYVAKGRRDTEELKEAIDSLAKGKKYIPVEFRVSGRTKTIYEFSSYDVMIIGQLAEGHNQKEISDYMREQRERASSLSSIEKRLNQIRDAHGFTNNTQLIAYCKDCKII